MHKRRIKENKSLSHNAKLVQTVSTRISYPSMASKNWIQNNAVWIMRLWIGLKSNATHKRGKKEQRIIQTMRIAVPTICFVCFFSLFVSFFGIHHRIESTYWKWHFESLLVYFESLWVIKVFSFCRGKTWWKRQTKWNGQKKSVKWGEIYFHCVQRPSECCAHSQRSGQQTHRMRAPTLR